jgi:7-cyano-7-deazaguanine synthase in queuosine biosynthesis
MTYYENNPVEEYLLENKNLMLSVKSIAKRLGIKTKIVTYLAYKSCKENNLIRKVNPLEVGSMKTTMNTFTSANSTFEILKVC